MPVPSESGLTIPPKCLLRDPVALSFEAERVRSGFEGGVPGKLDNCGVFGARTMYAIDESARDRRAAARKGMSPVVRQRLRRAMGTDLLAVGRPAQPQKACPAA